MKEKSIQKLENFKPLLRNGTLSSKGNKVVFEVENPFNQVILPIQVADVISLCNGKNTVKEIIEKIFSKQKSVGFRSICLTLLNLKRQGFLENGQDLEDPGFGILKKTKANTFTRILFPTKEMSLVKKISYEKVNQVGFYFLSIFLISTSLSLLSSSDLHLLDTPLAWIQGSFSLGILFVFGFSSLLLTLKTLMKILLLLSRTGKVYNLSLKISPVGLFIKTDHQSSHLIDRVTERCLFHVSSALSYIVFGTLLGFLPVFSNISENLFILSLGLMFWDLNPYFKSEMSEFFKSIGSYDKNNPWYLVQGGYSFSKNSFPFIKGLEYKSIYNFSWTIFTFIYSIKVYYEIMPYGEYAFSGSKSPTEKVAVIYFFALFTLIFGSLVGKSLESLLRMGAIAFEDIIKKTSMLFKRIYPKQISKIHLIKNLSSIPVLNWFSDDIIEDILDHSEILMFKKGMIIFEENDDSLCLFVLIEGQIRILQSLPGFTEKRKIITLNPISIFGESSILENDRRLASAVSKTESCVIKIPAKYLINEIKNSEYSVDLDSFRTSIMVDQFFHSAPIFSDLTPEVVQYIVSRSSVVEKDPDETVFKQGEVSRDFFMILRGSVDVIVNKNKVNQIPQGGFFGEIGVIASLPRTATVQANRKLALLKIDEETFWELMTRNIELALMVEAVGQIRLQQDLELFNDYNEAA